MLRQFVYVRTAREALVYTDDATAYRQVQRTRAVVRHSVGECVRGQAHSNGLESFWALRKRGYMGVYHHMSLKRRHRYINACTGRHNVRPLDTQKQLRLLVQGAIGKRLTYTMLTPGG